jgi:soluble lytic murein transglycosylase-like protein
MAELASLIWIGRAETPEASEQRLRWGIWTLLSFPALALAVAIPGRTAEAPLASAVRLVEASAAGIPQREEAALLPDLQDRMYDEFLNEFKPLRGNTARRRYLTGQVLAAAAEHYVDADLLFALIAAESSFDSNAVSSKGARGLGQMMFTTARAVAPGVIRRVEDLHDVPRNLYATALLLRQLLDEHGGDLRAALRTYYAGPKSRYGKRLDWDQYIARVSTYYAYLKTRRTYQQLTAMRAIETGTARN